MHDVWKFLTLSDVKIPPVNPLLLLTGRPPTLLSIFFELLVFAFFLHLVSFYISLSQRLNFLVAAMESSPLPGDGCQNKILFLSVGARLGCSRCLFIGRRLLAGSPPCLTRMADSEHILIYRASPPGAPHTGLNTAACRCSDTFFCTIVSFKMDLQSCF